MQLGAPGFPAANDRERCGGGAWRGKPELLRSRDPSDGSSRWEQESKLAAEC